MKKTAVFMSLILIFNLLLFVPVLAEQEIIAEPSVAAGYNHVLGLNQYGRVFAAGDNTYGQCDTFHWRGIKQICAGETFSAGRKEDGTVVIAGELSEETGISADELFGIVQISAGNKFLAALDENGNVYIVGDSGNIDVSSWENIEKIACGNNHVVALKDNTVIGSDYNDGDMPLGFEDILVEDILVEDIYAGEDLTIVKDSVGKLYHYGKGTYITGSSEEASKWICSEWEYIQTLDIQKGSNENAIVIAVNNNGEVLTDGIYLDRTISWSANFLSELQSLSDVSSISVFDINGRTYAVAIKNDAKVSRIININDKENPEEVKATDNLYAEIQQFDLIGEPISFIWEGIDVVPGKGTIGFLLPNGDVCAIGQNSLSNFKNIKNLTATPSYDDYFIGVGDDGDIYTNIPEDDVAVTLMRKWKGVEKIATWSWDNTEKKLITALRWDGRVYSTYDNGLIESYQNVTDISGGHYYMAALTDNKVKFYNQGTVTGLDASGWPEDIDKICAGYSHIIARSKSDGWMAAGKTSNGEGNVSEWPYDINVACGQYFTVAVDNEGKCYYTGKESSNAYKGFKEKIIGWGNFEAEQRVKKIFAANNYVVAYKENGTFDFATRSTGFDEIEKQIKNTYYKDNTFYTYKIEENVATIEYYSDEDIEVYFSYFDEEGRPIGFEKKNLPSVDSLTKAEFVNNKSHSFTISVGEPTADKMKFYMEQEADGDTVKIRHCSLEGQRIMLAFYDDDGNMIDIKVKTLGEINSMTETSFSCATATKYKLFIREGVLPLYKTEGTLN